MPRPILLTILDGWGYSPESQYNAIVQANTPNWDHYWQNYPHTLIDCSGPAVGLPEGQMGNSEVGHMHMGAGRIIAQDYTRINHAIDTGEFFNNKVLLTAIQQAITKQRRIHIIGLLSPGGVHSHEKHIHALIDLIHQQGGKQCAIHAILDGRDTPPRSAQASLKALQQKCAALNCGEIVSIVGRYYAMDRDQRWQRTQHAYQLFTQAKANYHAQDPLLGLMMAYARDENDEFVQATITTPEPITIAKEDVVICINFRSDRMRQMARAFTEKNFSHFQREQALELSAFVTLTQYAQDIEAQIVFPPLQLQNTLGEYLASQNLKQLRIAETEKYAHVTFFF
ncbi:MAG: 2,3-bisphosphoglycerate-independent phosphoglycerate mutase, partial [Gammaproteobacteria bacterium]